MDIPRSSASSIIVSELSADIGAVEPHALDVPHDQAPGSVCLAIKRDDVFYFETIVFQVEDTLFRVFKSGFEVDGSSFEAIFSLPQTPGELIEGTYDSSPIYLHGISKFNFRNFLRVLYPFTGAPTTYVEWIGALDLAIMWDFKEIRKTCVEALTELIKSRTVFDNILLARKYKVKKWLRDGYVQILQEKGALELGDDISASELDMVTIAKLLYIRERKHCQIQLCARCCSDCDKGVDGDFFSNNEANQRIDEVFAEEIAGMQDD